MIQFQENAWTEGWTEGQKDPILYNPSATPEDPKIKN